MNFLKIGLLLLLFIGFRDSALMAVPIGKPLGENVDDERNLKILSWNIYMLPKLAPCKGRRERAHAIVAELKDKDFDIIVFEEAFLPASRKIILAGLGSQYQFQYGPVNNTPNLKSNGGVWVLSKVKMSIVKTIKFNDCATWDCLVRKGAMLLEGTWNGKPFQVMGTHLQADEYQNIRYKQMDQIYMELLAPYRREGVPQLVCGDMNTEVEIKERYCAMLDCFGAENGEISGIEKCTYDGCNNNIAQSFGVKNKTTYDYILVRNNGIKIKSVKRFVSVLKKGKKYLSDHYGIVCELKF
ncbi:MAG: Endonuclease/exonuclease/phosphatase [Bacteroidota bacterium]|nr:Endonuclease/exonuclease/phosphatase [Bacteroidota bacterium]